MLAMEGFYAPPGSLIEPGDVFHDIPFPRFHYPLVFFRPNVKDKKIAHIFTPDQSQPRPGDSPKAGLEIKTVMFMSHGCEVQSAERTGSLDRRGWLAAPIESLSACEEKTQQRTREGTQPNKFYLPATGYLGNEEFYVDLRKITPIACRYFTEVGRKMCSLTDEARLALYSKLGEFFSGLAIYAQPIPCPQCGLEIDPSKFFIESVDGEDAG